MEFEYQKRLQSEKDDRRQRRSYYWDRAGTIGLWTAALVGLAAIIASSVDSARERSVIRAQIDEMRAEQRAWIYPDIKPAGKFFWVQGVGLLDIPVLFTFHNIGHLPAQFVLPVLSAEPVEFFRTDIASSQRRVCRGAIADSRRKMIAGPTGAPGVTVFPGQTVSIQTVASVGRAQWAGYVRNEVHPGFGIFGCVVYGYGGGSIGATGFTVYIAQTEQGRPGNVFSLPADPTSVPAERLRAVSSTESSAWQAQ